ncbi:hypothetical protein DPMN_000932, partial [Dreissena polymorpha]
MCTNCLVNTGPNLLTIFKEDWTINVVSRVLSRQMLVTYDGRLTKGNHKRLNISTLCS